MSLLKESRVDFEQVNLSSVINSLDAAVLTAGSLDVSGAATINGATTLNGLTTIDGVIVYGYAETAASTLIITSGTTVDYPGVVMTAKPAITFGIISSGVFGQQLSIYAPNITEGPLVRTNFTVTGIVNGGSATIPRFDISGGPVTGLSAQLLCITNVGQFRWMLA